MDGLHSRSIRVWDQQINVDLKAWSDTFYRQVCGTRLQPVLRNIEHIVTKTQIWIEITTLLIPGLNDDEGELREHAALMPPLKNSPLSLRYFAVTSKRSRVVGWKLSLPKYRSSLKVEFEIPKRS